MSQSSKSIVLTRRDALLVSAMAGMSMVAGESALASDSVKTAAHQGLSYELQFSRGDSFYDAHGSAAKWATPGRTLLRWGDGLCWCRLPGRTA